MKRHTLRRMGLEGGESQLKNSENIFNKIIEEKFPNLKKDMPVKIQQACRIQNRFDKIRNSLCHMIIKTLNI